MRRSWAALGLWAILASGCNAWRAAHPPQEQRLYDPFDHRRIDAAQAIYTIEWWRQLVTDVPLLEYAPTEPAAPSVDPDTHRVMTLTRDGYIRCLSPDGRLEWSVHTPGRFIAGAAFRSGVVFVAGGDGILYAINEEDGRPLWQYEAGEELATTPSFAGELVLVASQTDTLFAVNARTGKWVWQYRRDTPNGFTIRGVSGTAFSDGTLYAGFSDGHIVALNAVDGAVKWDHVLSTGPQFIDVDATPVLDEKGNLFTASYKDGLYALDAASGNVRWHVEASGINRLLMVQGMLVAGGDERLAAYEPATGAVLWSRALDHRAARSAAYANGLLLVPTTQSLLFVDSTRGKIALTFNPGKGVSATPAVAGSRVYVLSNGGYLYALRLRASGS